jgi:hypothetical protein
MFLTALFRKEERKELREEPSTPFVQPQRFVNYSKFMVELLLQLLKMR